MHEYMCLNMLYIYIYTQNKIYEKWISCFKRALRGSLSNLHFKAAAQPVKLPQETIPAMLHIH